MNKEKRDLLSKHHTVVLLAEKKINKKKNKPIVQLECNGEMTADNKIWSIGLHDHCISKCSGVSSAQELNIGFRTFLSIGENWIIENRLMPKLTLCHIVRAKTGLSKGPSSGGGSRLTADMLCVSPLTFCFCFSFLEVCKRRYFGGEELMQAPTSWQHMLMICLNNVGLPSQFTQFRGIALLDAMAKWYMAAVVLSIAEQIKLSRVNQLLKAVFLCLVLYCIAAGGGIVLLLYCRRGGVLYSLLKAALLCIVLYGIVSPLRRCFVFVVEGGSSLYCIVLYRIVLLLRRYFVFVVEGGNAL